MDLGNASWAYNEGFKIKFCKCNNFDNEKIWVMQNMGMWNMNLTS